MRVRTMSQRPRRRTLLLTGLLLAVALAAGCSSDDSTGVTGPAPGKDTAVVALATKATVIDVRTPEEFAAGHIAGATNLDAQAADFADRIADLDPKVTYVVYCRSGRRSAAAVTKMRAAGITALDGGGIGDMEAAGYAQG